jgi:hypothetical protein
VPQQEINTGKIEAAHRRHIVTLVSAWDASAGKPYAEVREAGEALADALVRNALGFDRADLDEEGTA